MRIFVIYSAIIVLSVGVGVLAWRSEYVQSVFQSFQNQSSSTQPKPKPLDVYSIPALQKTTFTPSRIALDRELQLNPSTKSYLFFFHDQFALDKRVSGTITLPPQPGKYPVIVMLRGWADENVYYPGYGTKNAASYYARNGFITVAPDFLGYGESSPSSSNLAEARFQMYTTALSLLASLDTASLELSKMGYTLDTSRMSLWGHSNGGQIALTVLTVTRATYPTILWAPVTIPFPDNVLHYAADMSDNGILIKTLVAEFRREYDPKLYSMTHYAADIRAPLLLHQGNHDDAVPHEWSDAFAKHMQGIGADVTYHVYPEADHNLRPDWNTVVARDVQWLRAH